MSRIGPSEGQPDLVLAVETSSAEYGVAVGPPGALLAHRTLQRGPGFGGIGQLAADLLAEAGAGFGDLGHLAVDVGPGNLSSVRTGIAYVNGLAFSLGRKIFCAGSLELLARQAAPAGGGAVICLRKAGGGDAYAGLFVAGLRPQLRHGPLAAVVAELCQGRTEVTVAGAFRAEVGALLPETKVRDSGVAVPDVVALHRLLGQRPDWRQTVVPVASPVTETAAVFDA